MTANFRLFTSILLYFIYTLDEVQPNIVRHALKTVCTDVTNVLLNFVAAEHIPSDSPTAITSEV